MNQPKVLKYISATIAVLTLSACGKVKSTEVSQTAWNASYTVEVDSNSHAVTCRAMFRVGSALGTFIELDSSVDTLTCAGQKMVGHTDILGQVEYVTDITANPGQEIEINLNRKDGSFKSRTTLPRTLDFKNLKFNAQNKKGQPLLVTWEAGAEGKLYANLNFTSGEKATSVVKFFEMDPGMVQFEGIEVPGNILNGPSPAQLTLTRTVDGSMPKDLNGSIQARVVSKASVTFID